MIGKTPLRIPNKILEMGTDQRYREDMETIERLVNSLNAPATGKVFPPYDGVVDYDLTPDHANGIYETPFTAINDLCNNKKVRSPVILVMGRSGVSPGRYAETANVAMGSGSTLNTGITIIFGRGPDDVNSPDPGWLGSGHTCDLGGGTLTIVGAAIQGNSDAEYASNKAPFINVSLLICRQIITDEFTHRVAVGSLTTPMGQLYVDCNTALTFDSGLDSFVIYYGGRWDIANLVRLGVGTGFQGGFFMEGTRITGPHTGTANIGASGSTPQPVRIHGSYLTLGDAGNNTDITIHISFVSFVDIDIEGGFPTVGPGSISLNMADSVNPKVVKIRGDYNTVTVTANATAGTGALVDIDVTSYGVCSVSAAGGKIKAVSNRAGHVFQNLHGAEIDVAIRDVGTTAITVAAFTGCVQCRANIAFWSSGSNTGNTPYSFDATSSKNMLDFAGASTCPNAGTDAGAGDLIRTT